MIADKNTSNKEKKEKKINTQGTTNITSSIHISVRNLVEFILRSGDIDNRKIGSPENAMAEGSRIHRALQKAAGKGYEAEVYLQTKIEHETYTVVVEGRADGIFSKVDADTGKILQYVDEIKSMYMDVSYLKEPISVHLAQAMCYAYMYSKTTNNCDMGIRMTYVNIDTNEIIYFFKVYSYKELSDWFFSLMEQYKKWTDMEQNWTKKMTVSIQKLEFPFPYREGQKEFITHVYHTIYHKKKLFVEAPTGVGKTISTIFPSLKAIGVGYAKRLFYLTAKNLTGEIAQKTFSLLRDNGLHFKTISITAKEKICPLDKPNCNPEECPYAKGHLDRINNAIYDIITNEDDITKEKIIFYANKHMVCPFEYALDVSLFCDGIICDYNYLFDPHVYLKRYFGEGGNCEAIFLIDEAHNLLERGRNMYSAVLIKEDFLEFKKMIKPHSSSLEKLAGNCNIELLHLKRECNSYCVMQSIGEFIDKLNRFIQALDKYVQDNYDEIVIEEIKDFYFAIRHFLIIYEKVNDNYVIYSEVNENDNFVLHLYCVNPHDELKLCMDKGRSSLLFSATLLPIQYYKKLLGGEKEDYEIYAKSIFDPQKKGLFIATDVTSKYSKRSKEEYQKFAEYIHIITNQQRGNYMVFCPSHAFMHTLYDTYMNTYFEQETTMCIMQDVTMSQEKREEFLEHFSKSNVIDFEGKIQMEVEIESSRKLIGFCVMGGIFSEGIDLTQDRLIGAIVIGTGIPQISLEKRVVEEYFNKEQINGYDYAYRFPGMNKVLQASGRVIRTEQDTGVVVLLDARFLQVANKNLFPQEWDNYKKVTRQTIENEICKFWTTN